LSSQQLFSTLLASEIRGELLVLFHRNPGLIDNLDGVARRIGRTAALIEQDVRALVEVGVLIQKKIGNSEVIRLDRQKDREILDSVANQIRNIDVGGEK
jgi:predicted transcriptional regulator